MARLGIVCLLSLIMGLGCAYRLAGRSGPRVAVAVETLTNETSEPGVELVLGAALRRELSRAGRLRLVEDAGVSGFVIAGRVAAVDSFGRTFTPGVRALEFTLTVRLDLVVRGPPGRRVSIDPFVQQATEIYLASADIEISRKNRTEALRRVMALLASRIRAELERTLDADVAAGRVGVSRSDR